MQYYFLKSFQFVFKLIKWFFWAIFLLVLLGLLLPYLKHVQQYEILKYILPLDQQIINFIHYYVSTNWRGTDLSRVIALAGSLIFMLVASNWEYNFGYKARLNRMAQETNSLNKLQEAEGGAEKLAVLNQKMQQIHSASRKDREALLNEFVAIKKQLESMGRNLAFLSVDVVDSTGMKKSEDPIVVTHDFVEYRKFAESKLNAYGCIKSTWTPDGIMACFNTVEEAIRSAQAMITGLKDFNRDVKAMKQDFAIRCGVNAGYLLFDDSLPLEQISDRVIDIAGHMQKHAEPNTIFLAKSIVKPVESPNKFITNSKVIDDLEVCKWEPIPTSFSESE